MRSYSASCREARHIIKGLMIKPLIIRESNPFTEKSRKNALLLPKPTYLPMESLRDDTLSVDPSSLRIQRLKRRNRTLVLLRLRLKHELGTDAAALSVCSICLRGESKGVSFCDCAPFKTTQLRHGKHFRGFRGCSLGDCVRDKRPGSDNPRRF